MRDKRRRSKRWRDKHRRNIGSEESAVENNSGMTNRRDKLSRGQAGETNDIETNTGATNVVEKNALEKNSGITNVGETNAEEKNTSDKCRDKRKRGEINAW